MTSVRGAKATKSMLLTPAVSDGLCRTRKIDGSGWSYVIEPIAYSFCEMSTIQTQYRTN